jgi:hypothetical protein
MADLQVEEKDVTLEIFLECQKSTLKKFFIQYARK